RGQLQKTRRVEYGRLNLLAIAYDRGVADQPFHVARRHAGHALDIELCKCLAQRRPLDQDDSPRQTALENLLSHPFQMSGIRLDRRAPLTVVVFGQQCIAARPAAARPAVTWVCLISCRFEYGHSYSSI